MCLHKEVQVLRVRSVCVCVCVCVRVCVCPLAHEGTISEGPEPSFRKGNWVKGEGPERGSSEGFPDHCNPPSFPDLYTSIPPQGRSLVSKKNEMWGTRDLEKRLNTCLCGIFPKVEGGGSCRGPPCF